MPGRGRVAMVTLVTAGAGAGAFVYGMRWRRVEQRRVELNADYAVTMEQLRRLHEKRLAQIDAFTRTQQSTMAMRHTVDTLWRDRLQRYKETNADVRGYLASLPEALGALHGLTTHYMHLGRAARDLVGFDVSALKLHSLALLLTSTLNDGTGMRAATLRHLFPGEPLVQAVGESLASLFVSPAPSTAPKDNTAHRNNNNNAHTSTAATATIGGRDDDNDAKGLTHTAKAIWPVSLRECDETFAYCMTLLQQSLASKEEEEEVGVRVRTAPETRESQVGTPSVTDVLPSPKQQSPPLLHHYNNNNESSSSSSGVWSEVVGEVVRRMRVDELAPQSDRPAPHPMRHDFVQHERNRLHCSADVAAAVTFVEELLRRLTLNDDPNAAAISASTALHSPRQQFVSATTVVAKSMPVSDASPASHGLLFDTTKAKTMASEKGGTFRQAVRALQLWHRAACVYLAQAQALEALRCYDTLLGLTMTQVNAEVV